MVSIGMVIDKVPGVKAAKEIWDRTLRRIDHWTDGSIGALVEDTCRTGTSHYVCAGAIRKKEHKECLLSYGKSR